MKGPGSHVVFRFTRVTPVALPLRSPVLGFLLVLVVVLTTPLLLGGLGVPCLLKLVVTNTIVNPRKLGLILHSDDVVLSKATNLLCVVFLSKLSVSASSFGGDN